MAWRIDEAVVRGEIDNRIKGSVTGNIWFAGREEPVRLKLKGDCWRDMAGCLLEFSNPNPKKIALDGFNALQEGVCGDLTASRKVKVPTIPLEELENYYGKKSIPFRWGNSLYLEWFSDAKGAETEAEESESSEAEEDAVERILRINDLKHEAEDDGQELYLRFYADEEWRNQWSEDFPEDVIPPHEDPPYERDHLLPQIEEELPPEESVD